MIYFIEKNIHGAWVIWGKLGIRQYYYYTKREAKQRYIEEARGKLFYNESRNVLRLSNRKQTRGDENNGKSN